MKENRMNAYLFKHIFGRLARRDVLLSLVNAVLSNGKEADVITKVSRVYRNLKLPKNSERACRLDLIGETPGGALVDIELQTSDWKDIVKLSLGCWVQLYDQSIVQGESPARIRPIIINLLSVRALEGEAYHTRVSISNCRTGKPLNDDLQIHFVELPKWESLSRKAENRLERWLAFLSNQDPAEVEEMARTDNALRAALEAEQAYFSEQLDRAHILDGTTRDTYELYLDCKDYEKEVQEGAERERIEIVKRLFASDASLDLICGATGLTAEEVGEIIRKTRKTG